MSVINTKLLFIPEKADKQQPLEEHLIKQGYELTTLLENNTRIVQVLASDDVSIVVLSVYALNQCHIELMSLIQQTAPKPVIVFADQCDDDWIMKAVNVGANSIVVDGIEEQRIKKVIEIATARFQRCMTLRDELSSTKQKLEERRDVDRAKGILMKKKKIEEDQAYKMLRKIAMDKNQRIGEVARTLILAAELLD